MKHKSKTSPDRAGFSLVETLLVVTLFAIVLSAIGPALASMLNLHTDVTIDLRLQRAIDRLSDDFRQDVRRARECRLRASASVIELVTDAGITTYSFHESVPDNYLHREMAAGDAAAAMEDYALAPGAVVEFDRAEDGSMVELRLAAPWSPRRQGQAMRKWIITARMGSPTN